LKKNVERVVIVIHHRKKKTPIDTCTPPTVELDHAPLMSLKNCIVSRSASASVSTSPGVL
jgi:hypothetical protein